MEFVDIKIEDFKSIINIIETLDNTKLDYNLTFGRSLLLTGDNFETEIYIKKTLNSVVISRVQFKNKRQGIMSKVLEEIKKITKSYGYNKVVVESVLTKEMSNFCLKHNFTQQPSYFGFDDYMGDYSLILD